MYNLTKKQKQKLNKKYRRKLIRKATKSELLFKNMLDKKRIKYIFQKSFIKDHFHCIVDFYLPNQKTCIEIDWGYHNKPSQRIKDHQKDLYLYSKGLKVVRIKNEDVYKFL